MSTSPSNDLDALQWKELSAGDRLIKFDRDTPLEQSLILGGIVVAAVGFVLMTGGRHTPPSPALRPYALGALVIGALLFIARWGTDNFYLVDPEQHRVYYHFKFLGFRRVRLLFRREDICAVATRGRKHSSRSSSRWEYGVVIIGANGNVVPITFEAPTAPEPINVETMMLATVLGCPAYESPERCELRVTRKNGQVAVAFEPLRLGLTRAGRRALIPLSALVMAFVAFAIWRLR